MGASSERYVAEQEAEERLRDAAPELLEALSQLYENDMEYIRINNLSGAENNHVLRVARAAIYKATGKQP